MSVSEKFFVDTLKQVLDAVLLPACKQYIREQLDNRLPPGLTYLPVYKDGEVVGFHPYVDRDLEKNDR